MPVGIDVAALARRPWRRGHAVPVRDDGSHDGPCRRIQQPRPGAGPSGDHRPLAPGGCGLPGIAWRRTRHRLWRAPPQPVGPVSRPAGGGQGRADRLHPWRLLAELRQVGLQPCGRARPMRRASTLPCRATALPGGVDCRHHRRDAPVLPVSGPALWPAAGSDGPFGRRPPRGGHGGDGLGSSTAPAPTSCRPACRSAASSTSAR